MPKERGVRLLVLLDAGSRTEGVRGNCRFRLRSFKSTRVAWPSGQR
jgi:hypothetical protein